MKNYTSYKDYIQFSGDTEITFSKFIQWARNQGVYMQIVKMPDCYGYFIKSHQQNFVHTGFEYWFEAVDSCVEKIFELTDDFEYINDILEHIKSITIPVGKQESIDMHKSLLLKSAESIKEILQMIIDNNFINEKCDNRIKDVILYMILAKTVL